MRGVHEVTGEFECRRQE